MNLSSKSSPPQVPLDEDKSTTVLLIRFGKFLSLGPRSTCDYDFNPALRSKISALVDKEEWNEMVNRTSSGELSQQNFCGQLLEKLLKEMLFLWLRHKAAKGGDGPNVLDEGGQGVLHFAAALGYDWAISPSIDAGASVNFCDVNGWTAFHWTAFYGRISTIRLILSHGGSLEALTAPTALYPAERTPANLAAFNGHRA